MRIIGLIVTAALSTGCAPRSDDLIARHKWAAKHPRPIDLAVKKAIKEAQIACGGGSVIMVAEGDQADHGADPADWQCADQRENTR